MTKTQIRWHQRLCNFQLALKQLEDGINLAQTKKLNNIEKQGLIKAFEFTHELAWNVMKDFFVYQGNNQIMGSRDAFREAFSLGLIDNGDEWMETIKSRNQTSHTYNQSIADEICEQICNTYFALFKTLEKKMLELRDGK